LKTSRVAFGSGAGGEPIYLPPRVASHRNRNLAVVVIVIVAVAELVGGKFSIDLPIVQSNISGL
jgi:hypothetical protein